MTEWISTKDALPNEEDDVIFHVNVYGGGEHYASFTCAGYFLDGKFYDNQDTEFDYKPWDGLTKEVIYVVDYWFKEPVLPKETPNG